MFGRKAKENLKQRIYIADNRILELLNENEKLVVKNQNQAELLKNKSCGKCKCKCKNKSVKKEVAASGAEVEVLNVPTANQETPVECCPTFDEQKFQEICKQTTRAFRDVPNIADWVEEQRGNK